MSIDALEENILFQFSPVHSQTDDKVSPLATAEHKRPDNSEFK